MRKQIDRVKNWKQFLNENKNNLPDKINIDNQLSQLRVLDKEKKNFEFGSKEHKEILDKEYDIEEIIKTKLWEVMIRYCDLGDYEGAKKFVGKSYGDMYTSGKVLLFRSILVHQKQREG